MHFESASFSTDYSQPNIKIVQFKCISDHKNFIPKYLDIFHGIEAAIGGNRSRKRFCPQLVPMALKRPDRIIKGYVCMYEFPVLRNTAASKIGNNYGVISLL